MRDRIIRYRALRYAICLIALAAVSPPLVAKAPVHDEGLGSLSFPNSGNIEAQDDFLAGVLLLHSFEYGPAADAFRRELIEATGFLTQLDSSRAR